MLHPGHPPSVILSVRENSDSTGAGEGQQGAQRAAMVERTRCVTSHLASSAMNGGKSMRHHCRWSPMAKYKNPSR